MVFFNYPKNAIFGRLVPKNKIYEHTSPSSALKRNFIKEVDQIIWEYKLAPETINLPNTSSVPEVQIFKIFLRDDALSYDVLHCIDKAIPFPIIFELYIAEKTKVIAAYKRPNIANTSKWIISNYFETAWQESNTKRLPLPIAHNLEALYGNLLKQLMPFPARPGEPLQTQVERMELIRKQEREIEKCLTRMNKEKQFSHKVIVNAELRSLKEKLELMTRS